MNEDGRVHPNLQMQLNALYAIRVLPSGDHLVTCDQYLDSAAVLQCIVTRCCSSSGGVGGAGLQAQVW